MPPGLLPSTAILHRLHRLGGLLAAACILFYSLTGIILNHRQAFAYFQSTQVTTAPVPTADLSTINEFISRYQQVIKRQDAPEVIRIKGGKTIELLYGSHGQTTYTIDPAAGLMTVETKTANEPLSLLNKLHKGAKVSALWLWLSDALAVVLILSTLAVLTTMRYRACDYWLLTVGLGVGLLGGFLA
jgi:hypothetical protein